MFSAFKWTSSFITLKKQYYPENLCFALYVQHINIYAIIYTAKEILLNNYQSLDKRRVKVSDQQYAELFPTVLGPFSFQFAWFYVLKNSMRTSSKCSLNTPLPDK